MAINVSVMARRNEHSERLIRRFIKKCKKEKVVETYRERTEFYQKPSVKKRNKKRRAQRLLAGHGAKGASMLQLALKQFNFHL